MFKSFRPTLQKYENLDGSRFKAAYESTPEAQLLDVRTPAEFSTGSLAGAQNIDVTSIAFASELETLDKTKVYFLFCRSGARSGTACQLMANQGFKVYNLAGGFGAWPV